MDKKFGVSASVIGGSNRVVASTLSDWSAVRAGNFIQFHTDNDFYVINKVGKFLFIKEFEMVDTKRLKIKGDIGISLSRGDAITLFYKEYELLTVLKIIKPGTKYEIGDILTVAGGEPTTNAQTGVSNCAEFIVNSTDENSSITEISIKTKGEYIQIPPRRVCVTCENGSDAIFEVEFSESNRRKIDKTIVHVTYQKDDCSSYLTLDYKIPRGMTFGDISVEKWELFLSSNYSNSNRIAEGYDIITDFTPNFALPLLSKNSFAMETIFNGAMINVDNQLKILHDKIRLLENK